MQTCESRIASMNKLIELSMAPSDHNITSNTLTQSVYKHGNNGGLQFDQMTVASLEGWSKKANDTRQEIKLD